MIAAQCFSLATMRIPLLTIAAIAAAEASLLVDWNLDDITGPAVNNAAFNGVPAANADVAANLTVTDLITASTSGHNGLVWSGGNPGPDKLNLQRWDHPGDNPSVTGNGNGNANNWLQFQLLSAPGFSLHLSTIEIAAWRNGAGAPAAWSAQTSADGGETWQPFGDIHIQQTSGDFVFHPVTFTGTAAGGALFVRFIATGPNGGTGNLHINRFVVNGGLQEAALPPVVTIEPAATLVQPGQAITLGAEPPDAPIRYTLDGTTPDADSTPYTGPITITSTTTVRAVALDGEGVAGPVAGRTFTVATPIGTPNVLLIVGSDIGFGDLHCNGAVNIATPVLDSLAYDGIRFTQFTNTGGGAHAAQFAMLTGRIAARSGMDGTPPAPGAVGWQSEEWSLAEMLRRAGYHTAFIGEWLLGDAPGSHPNDQGFQLFHGLPHAIAGAPPLVENGITLTAASDHATLLTNLTQRATAHIATADSPFFLTFQPPVLAAAGTSLAGPHGNRVEALDAAVGEVLAALDSQGIADETLVIFLGNGGAPRTIAGGSNGIFRDGAGTTWEGGLRAPLIARLPATLPAAQMNLSLVWMPDLMPTLTALVGGGLAPDRPLDGLPRADAITGTQPRPDPADTAFGLRHHDGQWQIATARQGKWKSHLHITNIDPENTRPNTPGQLYDLHIDAEERINRAGQQATISTDLATLAAEAEASFPPAGTTDLPAPKDAVEGGVSTLIESNGATTVRYRFIRPADSIDDFYAIQHSADLATWSHLGITPFITQVHALPAHREEVEIAVPLGAPPLDGPQRFLRMRAERPANP